MKLKEELKNRVSKVSKTEKGEFFYHVIMKIKWANQAGPTRIPMGCGLI